MAIAFGNAVASNQNPGGSTQTLAHTQDTGSDRTLVVVITMSNSVDVSGCTYAGANMNLIANTNITGSSQRVTSFYLQAPATGGNNIVFTFTGAQWNSTSIMAQSFTGAGAVGAFGFTDQTASPNSQSITILANSVIYATGISSSAQSFNYDIGGSSRTPAFNGHNTNMQVEGAWSATGLSAGAQNVTTKADSGNITNYRFEIKEAGSPPAPTNTNFLIMF